MSDHNSNKYIIAQRICEKCGKEFDWLFGVCPSCYPNGYLDAIKEIADNVHSDK